MRYLVFILVIIQNFCFSQDTIYKRTNDIISAKILEVGLKEISYKQTNMPDGPLFVLAKNDVRKIRYFNGVVDSFIVFAEPKPANSNNISLFKQQEKIQITNREGVYRQYERNISDKKMLKEALLKNEYWNNDEIYKNIQLSKTYKSLQYSVGTAGGFLGGATLIGCLIALQVNTSTYDNQITGIIAIAGAGMFISSQTIASFFKNKRIKHADKVAELYNKQL